MSQTFTTRPEIRGTFGAVTSTHWIASTFGMGILERGGNAFDAAVAAGFTLQIVEPHLNGPGGEVPIIIHEAGSNRPRVLCGQGVAPAAATIEHVRGLGFERMPGMGLIPAVIPGAFDATILEDLRNRGHRLNIQPSWSLGRLCAAGYTRSGMIRAAATPRFMQAYAVGR